MSSKTTEAVQQEPCGSGNPASPAKEVEIAAGGEAHEPDESPHAAQADGTLAASDTTEADSPEDTTGELEPAVTEDGDEAEVTEDTNAPEATETAEAAETVEAAEPTELIEMSEPVDLAEPVELTEPAPRGHAVLLALGFLVAAVVIIGAAVGIVGALTHGFRPPAPIVTYKTSPVFSLRTGECVNTNGQGFSVVSCAVPHDAEVYATFRLSQSAWPGTAKVRTAASAGCQSRLAGYLNPQLALSLASTYVFPGQVAWEAGTRTVICEVRAGSGQLTGSVRAGAGATA
jgi:hypothetical protein